MVEQRGPSGIGVAWSPGTLAVALAGRDVGFVEVLAERTAADLSPGLRAARAAGLGITVHGVGLSLGSIEAPDRSRLAHLAAIASATGAPVVSEHAAFVRSGRVDVGHLTPLPRTSEALGVLARNVKIAQRELPVPLAIENPAAVFDWPDDELSEAQFLTELAERTDCLLLLDLANAYVNARNRGRDPLELLDQLPLERVAYFHVAGGVERDGRLHDTHRRPMWPAMDDLIEEAASRAPHAGFLLERDDREPPVEELHADVRRIASARRRGTRGTRPRATASTAAAVARVAGADRTADGRPLGERQAVLARALTGRAAPPPGFDPDDLRAAARALHARRAPRRGTWRSASRRR